jgi:hypothetical protein
MTKKTQCELCVKRGYNFCAMFTPAQQALLKRILKSEFTGARLFARNVQAQGFMSVKQHKALVNMYNSIRPWSSRSNRPSRHDGWDHDDLAEGWDGY